MSYDRTQGDPKIVIDGDGADLVFKGGQPIMDSGLENAVLISLLSGAEWFGNTYFEPSSQIKSRFYETSLKPITITLLAELERAAKIDLAPLVAQGVFSDPIVTASNPTGKQVQVSIVITPPGSTAVEILLSRYGANWRVQTTNPANARV